MGNPKEPNVSESSAGAAARPSKLSKKSLIETAARLVYLQGWNATGINQILTEAKVPKGSFYYYFKSKEDLGVAIIKYYTELFADTFKRTLLNDSLTGRQSIESFFAERTVDFKTTNWGGGCPVGSFSNEVADTSEKISEACRECFNLFENYLEQALLKGQKDGSIRSDVSAKSLALQVSLIWQGMVLYMKTRKSEAPILAGLDLVRSGVFSLH